MKDASANPSEINELRDVGPQAGNVVRGTIQRFSSRRLAVAPAKGRRMKGVLLTFGRGILLMLMAIAAPAALGRDALPQVLGPSQAKSVVKSDASSVKSRTARPDVAALLALAARHAATGSAQRFVIDLFPDLALKAEVARVESRPTGATLFARLIDVELGSAVFTIEAGLLTATVDFPGGSYVVSPLRQGLHQVAQKSAERYPPEHAPRASFFANRGTVALAPQPSDAPVAAAIDPALTESGRLIDVMIVWTPSVEMSAGGPSSMQNLAQASIDSANAAYLNSGVAHRLRLVHAQKVSYAERSNCFWGNAFDCALDDVTEDGDGYLDGVHALREAHGADLVALFIDDGAFCGVAWLPTVPSPEVGFSVIQHDCAVGNKSFAHELGHNMGAHHDPDNADSAGPKPFNKGYVSPLRDWRTVMSYPGACAGCARLNHFSNPNLFHDGAAMGTASVANNAQVLNATGKAIASYRSTSPAHPVGKRFSDVPADHAFYGHIEFLAQAEITTGCAPDRYCPEAPVTRRQVAAFLERTMRASNWTPATQSSSFTDVLGGSTFAGHVEALRTDGITLGCTGTTFCPEAPVTRAQMAVFVLRARCGATYQPAPPVSQTFTDVGLDHPFVAFIQKMYSEGITGGCETSPLNYCPAAPVTRGEMATFIERAYPFVVPSESCAP